MNNIEMYKKAEEEYSSTFIGIRELSKKYNLDRGRLTGWLMAKGFNIKNRRAINSYNINYFDKIDTEEKAYWLGFLFADGAITQNKKSYNIELGLQLADKDHVRKFANAVNKTYINSNSTYRSRCILCSKHMFETLNSYGCKPKKSLILKFPNESIFKHKSLIRHFIRGYVEGDGCLSWANKIHTRCTISILGTKDFLDGIQRNFNSDKNYSNNNKKQNITKVLSFNGKIGFKFAKYIYKDCNIYLERKYNRYLQYCRLYQE